MVSGTVKKPSGTMHGVPQAGEYITVTAFFKRTHQRVIQYTDLPVVNVGSQDHPSYLPIDVCVVQRGQPARTNLSPDQTKQMISFAVRKPVENTTSIITNVPRVLGIDMQANSTLARFGLAMKHSLITVPGRVLNSPEVQYRYSKKAATRFGIWNMESIQFIRPAAMPVWSYLDLTKGSYGNDLTPLIKAFETELRKCGLDARHLSGRKVASFAELDAEFKLLAAPGAPKLMLVILPECHTKLYNRVKCLGDIEIGVHTVCVVASNFAKLDKKLFANVALKFNLKLGGTTQTLNPARLGVLSEGKTMVVGLDVTHPSPDSVKTAPSVAGIVASVDRSLEQWPADLRIQTGRQEMIGDLDEMFQSRLRLWQKTNQQELPENILVYRDGVSEGQYDIVLEEELPRMRTACRKIYPATSTANSIPKISIVIVGKRHHTRFYPTKVADADRSSNPQHGTIVDRGSPKRELGTSSCRLTQPSRVLRVQPITLSFSTRYSDNVQSRLRSGTRRMLFRILPIICATFTAVQRWQSVSVRQHTMPISCVSEHGDISVTSSNPPHQQQALRVREKRGLKLVQTILKSMRI